MNEYCIAIIAASAIAVPFLIDFIKNKKREIK